MQAKEVLSLLKISRQTLTKYVKEGIIKTELLPNGRYDYDTDSVYAFLNKDLKRKKKVQKGYCQMTNKTRIEKHIIKPSNNYFSLILSFCKLS